MQQPFDAVLLIAYGGPDSMDEVRPFLDNILRGKPVRPGVIEQIVERYGRIGGKSPLPALTRDLARRLEAGLGQAGHPLPTYIGMRNWHPFLAETLARMAGDGVKRAIGVICSAQQCDSSWQQYQREMDAAAQALGDRAPDVEYLPSRHDHPLFIEATADHTLEALNQLPAELRDQARIVFTAHSIPVGMAGADVYVEQIRRGAELTAERLGWSRWQVAYQSRSGRPTDRWLQPDICEAIAELGRSGEKAAVIMPIGFLGDHLEVLYDLDIEARQAAERVGMTFARAKTVGTHPAYIRMLVELIAGRCTREPQTITE